jgi:hypothetical protein
MSGLQASRVSHDAGWKRFTRAITGTARLEV